MRFAAIGTGNIVEKFIEAGRLCEGFALVAVYSRDMARARQFANEQGAPLAFDDLSALAQCEAVDAVYVASPNYAHCGQSMAMMEAGKHVLCEKPMASNAREVESMQACAKKNNVVLLEALKTVFEPGFAILKDSLAKVGTLRRVTASYCQYSSRYDKYKAGEVLNAFNPALSNGALMDIGVYCVHPVVKLFGEPRRVLATGVRLANGVDGAGTILLDYGHMQAELIYSKIADGTLGSEFQGEVGSLVVRRFPTPQEIEFIPRKGEREPIAVPREERTMRYEIAHFMRVVEDNLGTKEEDAASLISAQVMDEARRQMGIVYPADK